jgi:hypothetical protein
VLPRLTHQFLARFFLKSAMTVLYANHYTTKAFHLSQNRYPFLLPQF